MTALVCQVVAMDVVPHALAVVVKDVVEVAGGIVLDHAVADAAWDVQIVVLEELYSPHIRF